MNIVIRTDGSSDIGYGHVYRTLVLAKALRNANHKVTFLCNDLPGAPLDKIKNEGFFLYKIEKSRNEELELKQCLWIQGANWIIIDRYASEVREYETLRDKGYRVLAIDDICEHAFPVTILLNNNLFAEDLEYITDPMTIKLLGTKYNLIDDVYFQNDLSKSYIISPPLKFFVYMGGADNQNATLLVVSSLLQFNFPLKISIVINSSYKYEDELKKYISLNSKLFHDIRIQKDIPNLYDAALGSCLAFTAGGTTCLQMCAMLIPMFIIPSVPNQILVANALENKNVAIYHGPVFKINRDIICDEVESLITENSLSTLFRMHKNSVNIVKGCGAKLIIEEMEKHG